MMPYFVGIIISTSTRPQDRVTIMTSSSYADLKTCTNREKDIRKLYFQDCIAVVWNLKKERISSAVLFCFQCLNS